MTRVIQFPSKVPSSDEAVQQVIDLLERMKTAAQEHRMTNVVVVMNNTNDSAMGELVYASELPRMIGDLEVHKQRLLLQELANEE